MPSKILDIPIKDHITSVMLAEEDPSSHWRPHKLCGLAMCVAMLFGDRNV